MEDNILANFNIEFDNNQRIEIYDFSTDKGVYLTKEEAKELVKKINSLLNSTYYTRLLEEV